jgi:hypothetical protein
VFLVSEVEQTLGVTVDSLREEIELEVRGDEPVERVGELRPHAPTLAPALIVGRERESTLLRDHHLQVADEI